MADRVYIEGDISAVLVRELSNAEGSVVIPAGTLVRLEIDPHAAVGVHPIGGAHGVLANFSEVFGSELRPWSGSGDLSPSDASRGA